MNQLSITGIYLGAGQHEQRGQYVTRQFCLDISQRNQLTGEVYENKLMLQLFGDNCEIVNTFKKGQTVKVHFNLRVRGGKDKTTGHWKWVNVQPWKIDLVADAPETQTPPPPITQPVKQVAPVATLPKSDDPDDLPF